MGGNSSKARRGSDYLGVGKIGKAVVVEGAKGQHNLPLLSRDGNPRIRFDASGTFRQMRIYDKKTGRPHFDIDYTFEPTLSTGNEPVFHYHEWTEDGHREEAQMGPKELYEQFKPYLKGVEFHEKR